MKNTNAKRYAEIVRLYHEVSREAWVTARAALLAEVGEEEMENLSNDYDRECDWACEVREGQREEEMYR